MPDLLCKFLMFAASDGGSVSLSSVRGGVCDLRQLFPVVLHCASERDKRLLCSQLGLPGGGRTGPVGSATVVALCHCFVSGPIISGLYFSRSVSAMWSMSAVRTPVSVKTMMGRLVSMSTLV
jgi:hypothetical protein